MARGARRPARYAKLTPYEWRVFSRTGMLPSEARARGISLAAARGHAPRAIEPGGERIPEHRLRDIRRRLRGEPTEAERRWLRRQANRTGRDREELQDIFMSYSEAKRTRIREIQGRAARLYRASNEKFKWAQDAPEDWGAFPDMSEAEPALMWYH